jgi:hypothetical protein
MFLKYVAALLSVWYSVSIIGFYVHSCTTTGDTFVNSVLNGLTCEDIHPEHDCSGHGSCCSSHECHNHKSHTSSCCGDHDVPSVDHEDDCCTNDIEVLDSAGRTVQDDYDFELYESDAFQYISNNYDYHICTEGFYLSCRSCSGKPVEPDSQAILNIWRI